VNYSSLTQGVSWGFTPHRPVHTTTTPYPPGIGGYFHTSPYGLSSLTAVMRSLYPASSEYLKLTHSPLLAKRSCKQQGDKRKVKGISFQDYSCVNYDCALAFGVNEDWVQVHFFNVVFEVVNEL